MTETMPCGSQEPPDASSDCSPRAWCLGLAARFSVHGCCRRFCSEHRIWPLLMFTVAALSLFWLRTPVESLIGPVH